MKLNNLIVYRGLLKDKVLCNMCSIIDSERGFNLSEDISKLLSESISKILEVATQYGLEGNLWQAYIAYLILNDENIYSKSHEMKDNTSGSINEVVLNDFSILKYYFNYDFLKNKGLKENINIALLYNYKSVASNNLVENISEKINALSKELQIARVARDFKNIVSIFYSVIGVGGFAFYKGFRLKEWQKKTSLMPIKNIDNIVFDDLVGYESAKEELIKNTKAFVDGKVANNCLLFGDGGTGKSSCIKALLNMFNDKGLRIIEVYKHQFKNLHGIITQIKNRNYKFIIYMDDLSFEEFETEYKYLKAVIEGGLENKPSNVLIYATSNRRHLVREEFADRLGMRGDIHTSDTMQEKLSLASRFGLSIFFNSPNKNEFEEIVLVLAKKHNININKQILLQEANKWEISHGERSGRVAKQFIDNLLISL